MVKSQKIVNPRSPYHWFLKESHMLNNETRKLYLKRVSSEWNSLGNDGKMKFKKLAEDDKERFETASANILAPNACKSKCHKNLCHKCMCQANILLKSQQLNNQDIPDGEVFVKKTKNGEKGITSEKESNNFTVAVNSEIKTVGLKSTQNLQINELDVNEENTVQLDNLNKIQDEVSALQKLENNFNLKKKQNMLLNSLFK
jgi:hypothetical protein